MEDIKDKSIHHTAIKICEDFKSSSSYQALFQDLQKLVSTPNVKYEDFKDSLLKAMKDNGLDAGLRNNVYHWMKTKKKDVSSPYDAFFRKAQIHWDKRIHKSLNSMCTELGINLAKLRTLSEKEEISNKWNELSNYEVDIHKYRPVYAPKDFLEVLLNLRGPTTRNKGYLAKTKNYFSKVGVCTNAFKSEKFSRFGKCRCIIFTGRVTILEAERMALGEKVLSKNYAPIAQEFLKKGCPQCLRAKIWNLILGAEVKPYNYSYFESLKESVLQYDLMIDKLIIKDINLTASNDDQYFVFEDVLYQVMLCFSRDSEVLKDLSTQPGFMQLLLFAICTTILCNFILFFVHFTYVISTVFTEYVEMLKESYLCVFNMKKCYNVSSLAYGTISENVRYIRKLYPPKYLYFYNLFTEYV
ncbi:TBC1 domain family member 19 [Asbolus verrucosus]|uniref:TBC1 domain family member 19 n=1 Tax=Asbolus verrucosus TaxID=1661398 RepID=A0A482V8K2_ASBVE|nr:TBC1 domain family member 19 [Asbolus verrucosus]